MNLKRKLQKLRRISDREMIPSCERYVSQKPAITTSDYSRPNESGPGDKPQRISHLRSVIERLMENHSSTSSILSKETCRSQWHHLPGKEVKMGEGSLHIIQQRLKPDHHHGKVPVNSALDIRMQTVAKLALDPALRNLEIERALILDTETTGLAQGAGTVPFLVGLAWFEDGALQLEQLLLRSLNHEVQLLQKIKERFGWAKLLITYNGKSYDWPLLRTRFIMNRVAIPQVLPHLDLLHCARRVLKFRMKDVRLTEVETQLLGFHREGDIDGCEIPERYFRFLRGADPRTLLPIIEHNANDVIALAAILGRLAKHFESVQYSDDPRDHLAYAKLAVRAKDCERAILFAEAAVEGSSSQAVAADALVLSAQLARRNGDIQASVHAFHKALSVSSDQMTTSRIHLALAKLYEHQMRDFKRAYQHALLTSEAEGDQQHHKRLMRIERRLDQMV